MNVLIADSGSTKTQWIMLSDGKQIASVRTPGMNPYFITDYRASAIVSEELVPELDNRVVDAVFFYGAGCSTENNNNMLKKAIQESFQDADISIFHDILGAARALCGDNEGIACILGTGCNSCYYDGKDVYSKIPSLGYLFGDEGAGSHLGKKLLESYLKKKMPEDLNDQFDREYRLSLEDILNSLYNKPSPNRFLASFSHFIAPRKNHPFLKALIFQSFADFFEEHILKYENHLRIDVSFAGSVAWFYREILSEVSEKYGVKTGRILESPIKGLVEYHSSVRK